jgi:CelD/BcsL family acetyltransferase involved in cellulose biosynthesis
LQFSVIHPSELGPNEIAAWHSMQRETRSLTSPFLCPEFAIAIGKFRPNARVAVIADGPKITGFFPFERRRFGIGVPIGAGLTDCQGLIHFPGAEWDTQELLRACNISVWQFDHLVEGQQPFEGYAFGIGTSPAIDLNDGFPAYQAKLRTKSSKFCRQLASKSRILERNLGDIRFVVDSHDFSGLNSLMQWKSEQFRMTGWVNLFDRPWIVDLLDYLFNSRNNHFGGLLSLLYAGDNLVSAQFDIRFDDVLAGWIAAYDRRFSGQSPGLVHHLRKAEEAAVIGINLIDLGKGNESYKNRLKNHDLFVREGIVAVGSLRVKVHQLRNRAVKWAAPRIRRHPYLFRMTDQILRRYGRIA